MVFIKNLTVEMGDQQGPSSLSDATKTAIVNSLTLRRCFSLLYEQLEPSLLMPILNRNFFVGNDVRKRIDSLQKQGHKRAQTVTVIATLLSLRVLVNIPEICVALGARKDQQMIAQQLLKGMSF